jgi:cytochrome c oxidase subunit 3
MSTHTEAHDASRYYVPHSSWFPIYGSITLFVLMSGVIGFLNHWTGAYSFIPGAVMLAGLFFFWFRKVIDENQRGIYNLEVDRSFRMGMIWFIMSEVLFFAVFFGALFYARQLSVPWLGGEGSKFLTNMFLWKEFEPAWPTNGPASVGGAFETIPAFGLPAINTAILLTSGVTITIAHHALQAGNRTVLKIFLAATFLLGFLFVGLQAEEYMHAYHELNLTLGSGVYGSTFFMLTGFHGLHVSLGAIMLVVIWLRVMKGHFTPQHHFAFEAVAWYWHFVDVVWLGLFLFVYVLG